MSRRTCTASIAAALAATALGLPALRPPGIRVVIRNASPAPLVDFEVAHPGGTARFPRIEPGAVAEATIRPPASLPFGPPRELPIVAHFRQRGDRAEPVPLRCEPGRFRTRRLDLEVSESRVHRAVLLSAGMISTREVFYRRLARNAFDPRIGPRRFIGVRQLSVRRTVVRRRHWAAEFGTAAAVAVGVRDRPIGGTYDLLEYLVYTLHELSAEAEGRRPWPPPPSEPVSLPIAFTREIVYDLNVEVYQLPLVP